MNAFSPQIASTAWLHSSAVVLGEVELGDGVSVWPMAVLRGDCGAIRIGANSNIQDGTIAHATTGVSQTTVGAHCTVGHRVILHGCTIGQRCLVGMGSIVLDGVELGDDCFVAAGALLTPGKRYEPRSFLLGSPAKRVREVTAEEMASIDKSWRGYLSLMQRYRGG